jgi:hypothetical protein
MFAVFTGYDYRLIWINPYQVTRIYEDGRPVVIEAVKFINQPTEIEGEEPDWYRVARTIEKDDRDSIKHHGASISYHRRKDSDFGVLHIQTLEGLRLVYPGDWIIRNAAGEIYSCKPGVFEELYKLEIDARKQARSIEEGGL